ncbi:MAG TPA: type III pantothenate kinase [Ruminococcaceae bacterium]|jgi:type III pantothenate kinase|nr:type III pantothenate kinase [Oscillospiraceae bacterium]HBG56052.1 type III pantothenate kinase [Oscillospiraceae bacterium]HBQ45699.1 type III pantothenate kinase [Oscillospiraceae bacterium]HBT90759.1 type III pantothenate kinase [Oscillospiraceae bacterium]HCB90833.1 type III pantothenate kinase [Oscillospiraceae bacterium]
MILVVDIGNTNITLGVYRGKKLLLVSRMATDPMRMEDQYAIELREILALYGVALDEIDGVAVSSVVPSVNRSLVRAIRRLTGVRPICVGPKTKTGIQIDSRNAETVGADLVVGCVAAAEMFEGPCIIIDMGTATTLIVLDENRRLLGGAIAPGVGISLDALTRRTAQLPSISLEAPEHVIGGNTVECMRSGLITGAACMIDGMCARMEQELGKKCSVVATGGLSREIVQQCEHSIVHCDTLLLEGLRLIYERNKPQA